MLGIAVFTLIILVPLAIVVWLNVSGAMHWRRVAAETDETIERLIAAKRYIPWSELRPKLDEGKGTLIYEIRQVKGVHLVWWTEDDIIALSPTELPGPSKYREPCDKSRAFAARCVRDYTDLQSGTAMVTRFGGDIDLKVTSCCVGATRAVMLFDSEENGPYLSRGHLIHRQSPEQNVGPESRLRS